MLLDAGNLLARVLFEPACLSCQAELAAPIGRILCDSCLERLEGLRPPVCATCGDELPALAGDGSQCARCELQPRAFSIARSAGRYDGVLRDLIHALKFQGVRAVAGPLARLMAAAGEAILAGADAVVPVPLHPLRSLRRGFNQADDLARALRRPVWRAVRRRRGGPAQATLSADRRQRNLRDAFAPARRMRWHRASSPMAGAVVVLIDDVMTTGATLDGCARVLRAMGAAEVRALTAARTVSEEHPPRQPPPRPSAPPRRSAPSRAPAPAGDSSP